MLQLQCRAIEEGADVGAVRPATEGNLCDNTCLHMLGSTTVVVTSGLVAGSASRGLYRVHQFSKVEMFVLCTPQQSEALLEELADVEKEMFTELGLHFKILVTCSAHCLSV